MLCIKSDPFFLQAAFAVPLHVMCACVQENIAMMDEYIPLSQFKAVYIVDLCHSLCEQVRHT